MAGVGAPKPVVPVAPNAGAGAVAPNALVALAPPPNSPPPAGAGAGDPKGLIDETFKDEKEFLHVSKISVQNINFSSVSYIQT